jgi:murein DD-endopeptidase MepM/ murein hydrolase activator NlpD
MESMLRRLGWLLAVAVFLTLIVVGTAFVLGGRGSLPSLDIVSPGPLVGQRSTLEVIAGAPGARFTDLTMTVEQGDRRIALFRLSDPGDAAVSQASADSLRITRPFGKESVPDLQAGAARLVVAASRPTWLNLRTLAATASKEMVVYRVTPPDAASGVKVGDLEYPGYPASGADLNAEASVRVAFFALLHDQDTTTPIRLFARDEAGNDSSASFVERVFPKPFRRSRIGLDDRFLQRVVPEIVQRTPEIASAATGELLRDFLLINGDLRRRNAERIATIGRETSASRLWTGAFVQLGNSKVEAGFADHRTYVYADKEVDQQVHLGFDLAVTVAVPVAAANAGRVLSAGWLGIYGNCVIVDHGMGVASLYAHLSSMDVKPGDAVTRGQTLGRSGMTGLAGGDHLHFTMLVQGQPVNPVEWWDPHWIEDRITRKLSAVAPPPQAAGGV